MPVKFQSKSIRFGFVEAFFQVFIFNFTVYLFKNNIFTYYFILRKSEYLETKNSDLLFVKIHLRTRNNKGRTDFSVSVFIFFYFIWLFLSC